MNILVNLPPTFFRQPELEAYWARLGAWGDLRQTSHDSAVQFRPDLAWAEAVLMWSWPAWTEALLDAAPGLQYSGHLDITQSGARVALARGLPVSVSRGGWSPPVSEMALALILGALRRTSDYHGQMRVGQEKWVESLPGAIDPRERELTGRTVGLVGFGRVGQRLAELLAPFRCPLRIVDPFVSADVLTRYHARRVELPEMLAESDVVVLCAAANAGTRHLLGADEIARLRPNAVLVNVARAALIDTEALVSRLGRGDLSAALDVFDHEPLPPDSPLRVLPNVYLTPHRAGGLLASVERVVGWLIDDLEAVREGRPRQHALTEAMLPSLDA